MACYPCTHCNKCGMYSVKAITVCTECGTELPIGQNVCPGCGGKSFKTEMVAPDTDGVDAERLAFVEEQAARVAASMDDGSGKPPLRTGVPPVRTGKPPLRTR